MNAVRRVTQVGRSACALGCALALVGALAVVGASPAAAAVAAPNARVSFGDRSLTLEWPKVTGATNYEVQYSTSSSLAKAVTVNAGTRTWLQVTGLTNDKPYYARVVAIAGTTKKSPSPRPVSSGATSDARTTRP